MVTMAEIAELGRQIGEHWPVERVILSGSHARGDAREHSDVDLLVIMPFEGRRAAQAGAIRTGLRDDVPIDVLVRTPAELQQRVSLGDPFILEVLQQGKRLYGSADARMG